MVGRRQVMRGWVAGMVVALLLSGGGGSAAAQVADTTPAIITGHLDGELGDDNWYRSPVTVTWSVEDPESGISSTLGCEPWTRDTNTSFFRTNCQATNGAGLWTYQTVHFRIDMNPPQLTCRRAGWLDVKETVWDARCNRARATSTPEPG